MAENTPVGPNTSNGPKLPAKKPDNHTKNVRDGRVGDASGRGADPGDVNLRPFVGPNNNGGN